MKHELTPEQQACPHRRVEAITIGHAWVSQGEYDDDYQDVDVCKDCGAVLEPMSEAVIEYQEGIPW